MYTQCPDCSTAFRVTAAVLKQASGKVRCGGCGNAFNALEYLSEQMPERPAAKEPEPPLPELKPEPLQDEPDIPQSISAEQSAALLKTLDELAGSNIRIEDTGVEWRVFEDDDRGEAVPDDNMAGMFDTYVTTVDELLDESPTPVDQFLTATPNDIEAAEIFEESANGPAKTPVDELRFDDNTPLPEDFGIDDDSAYVPAAPATSEPERDEGPQQAEAAADLELSEPDEWTDLLDEFDILGEPTAPPLAVELESIAEEDAGDEPLEAGGADDVLDVDTQFALQAEAMGIDLSGMHESVPADSDGTVDRDSQDAEAQPDDGTADEPAEAMQESEEPEASGEPGEIEPVEESADADLVEASADVEPDEAYADVEPAEEYREVEPGEDLEEPENDVAARAAEAPDEADVVEIGDSDEPVEAAAAAPGDERDDVAAAASEVAEDEAELDDVEQLELISEDEADSTEEPEAPLEFGSIERELSDLEAQSDVFDKDYFDSTDEPVEEAAAEAEEDAEPEADDTAGDFEFDEHLDLEQQEDLKPELELKAEPYPEEELEIDSGTAGDEQAVAVDEEREAEHVIPPMTEEEQTINMMIDQDLMSMAIKDEDGFASTIVIPESGADAKASKKDKRKRKKKKKEPDAVDDQVGTRGFETIIMEGEFVRSALDEDRFESQAAEAAALVEEAKAKEAALAVQSRGKRMGMFGGIATLVLLLLVQGVHQWRDTLATIPAINSVIAPIYRLLGKPLSPSWDVRGWRFEATREVVGEDDAALTIYSRIGNKSDRSLPYPLINISLTDRFEETIGSRMLDPAEYLASGVDPRELVEPGENFEAIMAVHSPSADATGYKLKPCYRSADDRLRCHIPDFK